MSKFFKGEKVIIVRNPGNQQRGSTRIGTIVSIEKRPIFPMITGELDLRPQEPPTFLNLYSVQVIEDHAKDPIFSKILYNLVEDDLMHYSETAEALYC